MSAAFPLVPGVAVSSSAEIAQILANPGFGVYFTDHMAQADWTAEAGWQDSRIGPYEPFSLPPGGAVLHYAQEVFEGLKAYRRADGSVWLFRPELNARRLIRSAERMDLPALPEEAFLASVEGLVRADAAWVPERDEETLYLRPFIFASEAFLGVRSARQVVYAVVASPSGAYFASGFRPIDIWVTSSFSRAGAGGTGAAKCGGNYASGLLASKEAAAHGCGQVLFTDAAEHEWVEELGGMNVFFVTSDRRLLTPAVGNILEGITRQSVLELAPEFGLAPEARPISLTELKAAIWSRDITEAFACGTAAVITPIARFLFDDESAGAEAEAALAEPQGEMTQALRRRLVDIQWGRASDPGGWTRRVI
ncbi:MAG: branched-chain amino acid aminotransferase [Propionibacteriaceae bacterium]|jgi:branched-chain amino acid aminotransferase|nr:branched-chain amino acid aminotransferase [Propionibacteriaceae bacterium]